MSEGDGVHVFSSLVLLKIEREVLRLKIKVTFKKLVINFSLVNRKSTMSTKLLQIIAGQTAIIYGKLHN